MSACSDLSQTTRNELYGYVIKDQKLLDYWLTYGYCFNSTRSELKAYGKFIDPTSQLIGWSIQPCSTSTAGCKTSTQLKNHKIKCWGQVQS